MLRISAILLALVLLPAPSRVPPGGPVEPTAEPQNGECGGDRVRGTWRASTYQRGANVRWVFRIRRAGRELSGRITLTKWYGPRGQRRPPPCLPDQLAFVVSQPAVGEVLDDRRILFRGLSFDIDQHICGRLSNYYIDNFTGRLEEGRSVMRVVNNDGHGAVNDPYVFRRASCD